MRNELARMEQVDLYLDNIMNADERAAFEVELANDVELHELFEDQKVLREGIERMHLRAAAGSAYGHYKFWKLAPWIGGGLVVVMIATTVFLNISHEKAEHEPPQQPEKIEVETPVPAQAPEAIPVEVPANFEVDSAVIPAPKGAIGKTGMIEVQRGVEAEISQVEIRVPVGEPTLEDTDNDVIPNTATIDPQPSFPGGNEALGNYLMKNLQIRRTLRTPISPDV